MRHQHALVVQSVRHVIQHLFDFDLVAERVLGLERGDDLIQGLEKDFQLVEQDAQLDLVLGLDHLAWLRLSGL